MTPDQFQRIINEVKGVTTAVSLYNHGDPMVHPQVDEFCRIASNAGMQVHINTHFSFNYSDERIKKLVASGVTHLTVCVDGLTQDLYERTRVGGKIAWVLSNLERTCRIRDELGRDDMEIEAQFLKFQHNVHQLEEARALCMSFGVDQFSDMWGGYGSYLDVEPETIKKVGPKSPGILPLCWFPFFSMTIMYNGEVLPCCEWRRGSLYASSTKSPQDYRSLGNVFETSVKEVWHGAGFQQARALCGNPTRVGSQPELKEHFCDSCPSIYNVIKPGMARPWGKAYKFEDVYRLDEHGRPVRHNYPKPVQD